MVVQVSERTSSSSDSNNSKSSLLKIPTPSPTPKDKIPLQYPQKTPPQSHQKNKTPTPPTSPKKPSCVKETNPGPSMSDDNSIDSSKTKQNKAGWRAAKFVEYICQNQGFDTNIDASLITSWFNPIWRLLDSDYVPHLTYSEPPSTACWNIPLSQC